MPIATLQPAWVVPPFIATPPLLPSVFPLPEPNVSTGKVLVIVNAAGVNRIDWKIREGYMRQMIQLQFPSTLGMDFSGVMKQIGEGVSPSDFEQGDEVYGQAAVIKGGSGAFAEMALASQDSIAHKPILRLQLYRLWVLALRRPW